MNARFALIALLPVGLCACKPDSPPPATAAAATKPAVAELSGQWSGNATIVVNWVKQQNLPVAIVIAPGGKVTGTVGDATLVNARLHWGRDDVQRSLGWGRDYRIHGDLQGPIVKSEGVQRDAVDIVFNRSDDGSLHGGLHSSGSKIGGKDAMKLSAGNMVLTPPRSSAGGATGGSTTKPTSS